uniref:F-box domain-containing protein n=1 Tax=Parastrongyloides trichosuri TaxID=131310 RepID=A0A0N4Z6P4_PARTI
MLGMETLPDEILANIFSYLNWESLPSVRGVSRRFCNIIDDNKNLLKKPKLEYLRLYQLPNEDGYPKFKLIMEFFKNIDDKNDKLKRSHILTLEDLDYIDTKNYLDKFDKKSINHLAITMVESMDLFDLLNICYQHELKVNFLEMSIHNSPVFHSMINFMGKLKNVKHIDIEPLCLDGQILPSEFIFPIFGHLSSLRIDECRCTSFVNTLMAGDMIRNNPDLSNIIVYSIRDDYEAVFVDEIKNREVIHWEEKKCDCLEKRTKLMFAFRKDMNIDTKWLNFFGHGEYLCDFADQDGQAALCSGLKYHKLIKKKLFISFQGLYMGSRITTIIALVLGAILFFVSGPLVLMGYTTFTPNPKDPTNIVKLENIDYDKDVIGRDVSDFLKKNKNYGASIQEMDGKPITRGFIVPYPKCYYSKQTIDQIKSEKKIDIEPERKIKILINKAPANTDKVDICMENNVINSIERTILSLTSIGYIIIIIILILVGLIILGCCMNINVPKLVYILSNVPLIFSVIAIALMIFLDLNHYQLRGIQDKTTVQTYGLYDPGINFFKLIGLVVFIVCCLSFTILMSIAAKQRKNEIILSKA